MVERAREAGKRQNSTLDVETRRGVTYWIRRSTKVCPPSLLPAQHLFERKGGLAGDSMCLTRCHTHGGR
eukprot:3939160-Rhodomonas_salina.2